MVGVYKKLKFQLPLWGHLKATWKSNYGFLWSDDLGDHPPNTYRCPLKSIFPKNEKKDKNVLLEIERFQRNFLPTGYPSKMCYPKNFLLSKNRDHFEFSPKIQKTQIWLYLLNRSSDLLKFSTHRVCEQYTQFWKQKSSFQKRWLFEFSSKMKKKFQSQPLEIERFLWNFPLTGYQSNFQKLLLPKNGSHLQFEILGKVL